MKKIIALVIVFISLNTYGQKDFEGSIKYKGIPTEKNRDGDDYGNEKKDTLDIEVFFAPGKIKVISSEREDILVFIDSAVSYSLLKEDKIYTRKKLKTIKIPAAGGKEIIAGHPASSANSAVSLGMMGNVQYWLADDLVFSVPAELAGNEELIMVQQQKIMLKMVIRMPNYRREMGDENEWKEGDDILATITATEVKPGPLDLAIFSIPADYKMDEVKVWAADTAVAYPVDSAMALVDTVAVSIKPKTTPVKKKPTPAPVKTKITTKPPARKP